MVLATDRSYLREVLTRMAKRSQRQALPATLPEWKYVNQATKVWPVRHFDPKDPDDPSSPLAVSWVEPDEHAIGVVFVYDLRDHSAQVFYLSTNEHAVEVATRFWTRIDERVKPTIKPVGPDAIEISVPRVSRTNFPSFLLLTLGHGLAL